MPNLREEIKGNFVLSNAWDLTIYIQDIVTDSFHLQKVQELLPICQFIQNRGLHDRNFGKKILFSDEACTTSNVYAQQNPHAIEVAHHPYQFKINVWAGIPDKLDGKAYLIFLQNTMQIFLENLPLLNRPEMRYMKYGIFYEYVRMGDIRHFL